MPTTQQDAELLSSRMGFFLGEQVGPNVNPYFPIRSNAAGGYFLNVDIGSARVLAPVVVNKPGKPDISALDSLANYFDAWALAIDHTVSNHSLAPVIRDLPNRLGAVTDIGVLSAKLVAGELTWGDLGQVYAQALSVSALAAGVPLTAALLAEIMGPGIAGTIAAALPVAIVPYLPALAVVVGVAVALAFSNEVSQLGDEFGTKFGQALNAALDASADNIGQFLVDHPSFMKALLALLNIAEQTATPLILDLDGDGVETTNLVNTATGGVGANAVYWDIDNDGFREASAWVGRDDGLLVRDVNGNGVIDDHGELFGSATQNGFAALDAYADSNNDNLITSADANFNNLRVWKDANGDGLTQSGELHTLAELGITSINLNAATLSGTSNNDNPVSHRSTFVMNGQTRTVDDVLFRYDNTNSIDTRAYTFNPATLLLPELRGYGDVSTMSIAMSRDAALLAQMQTMAQADLATLTAPAFDLAGKITALMFRWAGVDSVNPVGRGDWDAQKLAFLDQDNQRPVQEKRA